MASHLRSVSSVRNVFHAKEKRWSGSRTLGVSESTPLLRSLRQKSRSAIVFEVPRMCSRV